MYELTPLKILTLEMTRSDIFDNRLHFISLCTYMLTNAISFAQGWAKTSISVMNDFQTGWKYIYFLSITAPDQAAENPAEAWVASPGFPIG